MSDAARAVAEILGKKLGLIPQDRFVGALDRAEADLVRRRGKGLSELVADIERDSELYLELAGLLSVGETYFLRHGSHFERLVEHVRRRLTAIGPDEAVRIWSAGCSSGEEPYSVAIAIHAQLGPDALDRVKVAATDVDPRAIAKAARARYTPWSFRGAPPWLVPSYFRADGDAAQRLVHPSILGAVAFDAMPLAARAPMFAPGSLDVVFFRNVAIYLLDEARLELHREMRKALREGGLLVQGPSDPPPDPSMFAPAAGDPTYCCYVATDERGARATRANSSERRSPRTSPARTVPSRPEPKRPVRVGAPAPEQRAPEKAQAAAPPAVSAVAPNDALERALRAAERGDLDAAWVAAAPLLAAGPSSPGTRLARGKILLAARALDAALEELRAAVYLDAEPVLPRYWYASALHAAKRDKLAFSQLRELDRRLAAMSEAQLLEDGETRATELLASVRFLMEAYQ